MTIEEAIKNEVALIITFKDGNKEYHTIIKKFDSEDSYERYCDTRMQQSGWKEIGTNIYKNEQPKKDT